MKIVVNEIREKIRQAVKSAILTAQENGEIAVDALPEIHLEIPREKAHGDYATNAAMMLAKPAKLPPRKIAEIILNNVKEKEFLDKVEIAGPGFINFYLSKSWLGEVLRTIEEQGDKYGEIPLGNGQSIQIEYVSANPTGPVHVGHGRGAAVGSVLAKIMIKAGYQVTQEHYTNDAGNQMNNCGKSVFARYQQLLGKTIEFPEDGYHGDYIYDVAKAFLEQEGDKYLNSSLEEALPVFREFALKVLSAKLKEDLAAFGVEFDVWFSERTLHQAGEIEKTTQYLKERGQIYEKDGALWLKSTDFGDDKDRVVIRENGIPTYLAADIAYHKNKFERGFDKVINIWGADHHGYIQRMKAAVQCLGYRGEQLEVMIMQLVTYLRNGQQVAMSKRTGEFVTLREVVEEIGKDAARYFYIMRNPNSPMEFDLELAKEKSSENPVYYIQYAHARICSILRQANDRGITVPSANEIDLNSFSQEVELDLIKKLAAFPLELEESARDKEPHRIARYTFELAGLFHAFYNSCRILGEEDRIMIARFNLARSTGQVLRNALDILGLSAPERM